MAIRLRVKSEEMSNNLVTMETDRQQFHKKCPILKVYQLPWLPVNKDRFCDILKVLIKTFHMRYRTIRSEHKPFLADKMCLFS